MATEVQTTYLDKAGIAYPGMLYDGAPRRVGSFENADIAAMVSGIFAAKLAASPELKARTLAAASDAIAGLILHTHARNNVLGQAGYEVGAEMSLIEEGAAYALAEVAMVVGDPVYARVVANGGNIVIGAIRKDSDGGNAMLVKGARVVAGGDASNPPAVFFDKALQEAQDQIVDIPFNHGAIAATTTAFVTKTKSDRQFIVDEVIYDNPTGFVQDAANTWKVEIKRAATSEAAWDTTTGQQGTLGADAPVSLINAALANRVNPPAQRIDLVITKTGAPANLPAGSGVIRGHYV